MSITLTCRTVLCSVLVVAATTGISGPAWSADPAAPGAAPTAVNGVPGAPGVETAAPVPAGDVSWYVMMGIGQVVTLRVPANRLREVNRAIEETAWGGYRTEFYPTYDYKALAQHMRETNGK
jgi:hypothetical protein